MFFVLVAALLCLSGKIGLVDGMSGGRQPEGTEPGDRLDTLFDVSVVPYQQFVVEYVSCLTSVT